MTQHIFLTKSGSLKHEEVLGYLLDHLNINLEDIAVDKRERMREAKKKELLRELERVEKESFDE